MTFYSRADRAAEASVIDDATMRGLSSWAVLRHPIPQCGPPHDRRVLLHLVRVGPEVQPERLAGAAIIEIPAQLDGTAAIVTLARRARNCTLAVSMIRKSCCVRFATIAVFIEFLLEVEFIPRQDYRIRKVLVPVSFVVRCLLVQCEEESV